MHEESRSKGWTELLIINEADRRKTTGLEQIGMPGIKKRFARYPQLCSSSGFAHEYRPLTLEELTAVLPQRLPPSVEVNDGGIAYATAVVTVRITGGKFQLVDRFLT
ncbi:ATP-binding protein [Cryobacterium melibiosiphilum]|uniref:ATP-binding protein n=1 Tax=Cryobacterium melibiosiphilum TaxID=995039 RepID=UPI001F2A8035|nr:ATP-binding protein [Cryobacterium melibiosiphilum]